MALINVSSISPSGTEASPVAASGGGDTVRCGERTFIHVANGGGSSVTVTVDDTKTREPAGSAAFDPNLEVVIAPGTSKFIGPLPASRFANNVGLAAVTYSGVSSVTVSALNV
jgi:hypothetical protein